MKCGNCEKNIPDGSKFCMYCGSEVQVGLTCHYCGFMGIPSGAFFCPACGAPLRREANVALDTLKRMLRMEITRLLILMPSSRAFMVTMVIRALITANQINICRMLPISVSRMLHCPILSRKHG